MEIEKNTKFSTLIEDGCIALESPDDLGNFAAIDSEGIECTFSTNMVVGHESFVMPKWFHNHPQFIESQLGRSTYLDEQGMIK